MSLEQDLYHIIRIITRTELCACAIDAAACFECGATVHSVAKVDTYMSVLKSPQVRHWLMSALRGKADISSYHSYRSYRVLP